MMKILIVEDHSDLRALFSRQVEALGFIPVSAKDGKEGLEKAIAEKPALILMDMRMPGMDGWKVSQNLRANPSTKRIPILAVTALSQQSELDACIEAGCKSYIIKPFTLTELWDKIQELLQ